MSYDNTNTPEQSVDYDFFHRIHDNPLGEKGNKDREEFSDKENIKFKEEKEKDKDVVESCSDAFNKATSDARQEFMHSINGRHFSDADLEEALNDIIDNKEEFQAKHELTDEEADLAVTHAIIMKSMTPEQRDDYLKDLSETNPTVANAIADQAEGKVIKLDNKSEKTSEASQTEIQAKNTFLADSSDSFELSTDKPDSVISATFKEEVDGVGANAQSFSLDEAPQVIVTEKAPDPFTLDS